MVIKKIIFYYEQFSGQRVNFDKSLLYFSKNTSMEYITHIGDILNVPTTNNSEKYLGLPTMVGRKKRNAFVEIKEHFVSRFQGGVFEIFQLVVRKYF